MKIQLVSINHGIDLSAKDLPEIISETINVSDADLILFNGSTLKSVSQLVALQIQNERAMALLELSDEHNKCVRHALFKVQQGRVDNLYTNQLIAPGDHLDGNYPLLDRLLYELETRRRFELDGKTCTVLMGYELCCLVHLSAHQVGFRMIEDPVLRTRFEAILQETQIWLDPMHAPLEKHGSMDDLRRYLSADKRYYFSASHTEEGSLNLYSHNLQHVFYNQQELTALREEVFDECIVRTFLI